MAIEDAVLEDWISAFEALPEAQQENVRRWFATQKIIIDASGLEPREWFGYVEWALDHPFDYSFIQDFPDSGAAAKDGAERRDETRRSRELVGGQTAVSMPSESGLKDRGRSARGLERELFDNFMKNRLGGK